MSGISDQAAQDGHDIIREAERQEQTGITDQAAREGGNFITKVETNQEQKAATANTSSGAKKDTGIIGKIKSLLGMNK